MKKFAAMALALVMCIGLVSCGDSGSDSDKGGDKETKAAAETKADGDKGDAETEADESEEPKADVETIELTNSLLGVKGTFDIPKFDGWEIEDVEEDGDQTSQRLTYKFPSADGGESNCVIRTYLVVDSVSGLDWFLKQNENIPNTEYTGYLTGTTKTQNAPMNFYTVDYMDGKVRVDVDVECYSEDMPDDQYQELLTTIQTSLKAEVLDTNGLYDSDGNLLTVNGVLSIPASVEIAGTTANVEFKTTTRSVHAVTEFTADGNDVTISDGGVVKSDIFDAFIEKNTKDQAYDCEVNGLSAKGRLWNDFGTLTAEYVVEFDKDTYYRFYVYNKGSLDLAAINEMMNGAERGDLEKQMNGYLSDFVSNVTRL